MSGGSRSSLFPSSLSPLEQTLLVSQVAALIPPRAWLPPAITVELRRAPPGAKLRIEAVVIPETARSRDVALLVLCEVTGCLGGEFVLDAAADLSTFREWAHRNPEHPLAIRFLPLFAWMLAASCDPRFLELAAEFVRGERARLRAEIVAAAQRVLRRAPATVPRMRGGVG